jgi:hypothetical protein
MENLEYRTIDKSAWGRGPWQSEPDKMQFTDEATGLPCLIVRGPSGALCGYVGVGKSHPYFEKDYDDCGVSVHGGLTFARFCHDASRENWEKFRESMLKRIPESKQYPQGDAAQAWKQHGDEIDDYELYAKRCRESSICHLVEEGEDDRVWWLGFDCAHYRDYLPKYDHERGRSPFGEDSEYRDIAYVKSEIRELAEQLAFVARHHARGEQS